MPTAANYARMGFVGFVKFIPTGAGSPITVRVQSADVKLSQEISYPDLVDGKVDQTTYQLGPQQVGGSLAFPLVHDLGTGSETGSADCGDNSSVNLAQTLWAYGVQRDGYGRMANQFDCVIRYADNVAYRYGGCLINTMQFTINQSEPVNVSCEVIGGGNAGAALRTEYTKELDNATNFLAPVRIITWNDAQVQAWSNENDTTGIFQNGQVQEFNCSINNNIDRIYSLNGKLAPVDIAAKKREVSGTIKTMGAVYKLSELAQSNQGRFTSNSSIAFGYSLGNANSLYWATGLYGVIFEIEEISLSTGLFQTTTKWRALGDCDNKHQSTKLGQSMAALTRPVAATYGLSTLGTGTSVYPQFDNYS
jgi:hypothetical protein